MRAGQDEAQAQQPQTQSADQITTTVAAKQLQEPFRSEKYQTEKYRIDDAQAEQKQRRQQASRGSVRADRRSGAATDFRDIVHFLVVLADERLLGEL